MMDFAQQNEFWIGGYSHTIITLHSNEKVPMMRDSPPLIEPYVIVTHHTAPLFPYLTLFVYFFFYKIFAP